MEYPNILHLITNLIKKTERNKRSDFMQPSVDLTEMAKQSMLEHQLLPDFPPQVQIEVNQLSPAKPTSEYKDLRHYLWFSLDNERSRDLDQLTFAEKLNDQYFKVYIAIADVDSLVKKNSSIDLYAQHNTTSVYTPTKIFSMLPEKLSTDLTSLNENQDRLAIVVEAQVRKDGFIDDYAIYPAIVRNKAKLAYPSVTAWLEGLKPAPALIEQSKELDEQVRLQDHIAQLLRQSRFQQGALTLHVIEPEIILQKEKVVQIGVAAQSRGHYLIEDLMIAANRSSASFLMKHQIPSLRRVVRVPKRWDRIITIARNYGERLPSEPDPVALNAFLVRRYGADPMNFPDLSLTIIKLLGNGEYVVEYPGTNPLSHFSLAVKEYTHATAPNRRFPDLITQRLIKSIMDQQKSPYSDQELETLAQRCTQNEKEATKVERKMRKAAMCLYLSSHINETFDALVTGAAPKGTWVRLFKPPVEGKLIQGFEHVDVGDRIRVKLVHIDIQKGFIDFIRV